MNEQQQFVFKQVQQYAVKKSQLLLFVSGEGGTGKSVLLRECVSFLRSFYGSNNSVVVVAPTGVAAYNVFGTTIHSAFRIPLVSDNGPSSFGDKATLPRIPKSTLATLREKFIEKSNSGINETTTKKLSWVFVDEISMVSACVWDTFNYILQEINKEQPPLWQPTLLSLKGESNKQQSPSQACCSAGKPFGGTSVVVFGDLLQLSPVKGRWIFLSTCWRNVFKFTELTYNERQRSDREYHSLCSRFRLGLHTEADVAALKTRVLDLLPHAERTQFKKALHVFTTKKYAASMNDHMITLLKAKHGNGNVVKFKAVDRVVLRRRQNANANDENSVVEVPVKISDEYRARLEKEDVFDVPFIVELCPETRVMLRANISVSDGLVNGRTGSVVTVVVAPNNAHFSQELCDKNYVVVRFDNSDEDVKIFPQWLRKSMNYNDKYWLLRFQIPLMYCWGVTAHKVQGLTLPKIVVRSKDLFCPGIGSVILSRVSKRDDLAFSEFCAESLLHNKPDFRALAELERLQQDNGMHLAAV